MWHKIDDPESGSELVKSFEFKDFREAFGFCTRVALIAERFNHHPAITVEYNKVTISTTSHDAGNTITERDNKLTAEIDKLQI